MLQIEKMHKRSSLMTSKKEALVDQIMYLEHNNNALHETLNQQAENFKSMKRDIYDRLDRKSFKVDMGHTFPAAVRLVDIEEELLR